MGNTFDNVRQKIVDIDPTGQKPKLPSVVVPVKPTAVPGSDIFSGGDVFSNVVHESLLPIIQLEQGLTTDIVTFENNVRDIVIDSNRNIAGVINNATRDLLIAVLGITVAVVIINKMEEDTKRMEGDAVPSKTDNFLKVVEDDIVSAQASINKVKQNIKDNVMSLASHTKENVMNVVNKVINSKSRKPEERNVKRLLKDEMKLLPKNPTKKEIEEKIENVTGNPEVIPGTKEDGDDEDEDDPYSGFDDDQKFDEWGAPIDDVPKKIEWVKEVVQDPPQVIAYKKSLPPEKRKEMAKEKKESSRKIMKAVIEAEKKGHGDDIKNNIKKLAETHESIMKEVRKISNHPPTQGQIYMDMKRKHNEHIKAKLKKGKLSGVKKGLKVTKETADLLTMQSPTIVGLMKRSFMNIGAWAHIAWDGLKLIGMSKAEFKDWTQRIWNQTVENIDMVIESFIVWTPIAIEITIKIVEHL